MRFSPPSARVALLALVLASPLAAADKLAVKVIELSGFEVGDDTGDAPGEYQFWVEREHLDKVLEVPGAPHPLRYNAAGFFGSVAGNTRDTTMTPLGASQLVMALCLDPRLDLTHAYWIINGISGIDPAVGSIGCAVWANNVVDGDAMREIDEREVPAGWPYGLYPIGADQPKRLPGQNANVGGWGGATLTYSMVYPLNPKLTQWAYALSKGVTLEDTPALRAWRMKYTTYPAAQLPPHVMVGDALGSVRYWHGPRRTQWARDWVSGWTQGKGVFTTTTMEVQDYAETLMWMASKGFLDMNRVMLLRGASNYCMPPPGQSVNSTMGDEGLGTTAAFEAAYRTGAPVVHELLAHWDQYERTIPGP